MISAAAKDRQNAVHLLRRGLSAEETANALRGSLAWVYHCRTRFEAGGWSALDDHSRAPHTFPTQLPEKVRQAIRQTRSQLEAEAHQPGTLVYCGAPAIRARLQQRRLQPLPSLSSIERELRQAGLTRPRPAHAEPSVVYPQFQPKQAHELTQVDIYPRYLTAGPEIACFNAIDVVSHYAVGYPYATKRAEEAVDFLRHIWAELGLSTYTQVDNESCFSGGFTHPYVLGQVLRLGLWVGTELIYSPFYHPQSNGTVERFHQDYAANTWDKIEFADLHAVRRYSPRFFRLYVRCRYHAPLGGQSPLELHQAQSWCYVPADLPLPQPLPLTPGQVHFMREVSPTRTVRILNVEWAVPRAEPHQGVWATLAFRRKGATLSIYDAAPDATQQRLAVHPFPLKEPVVAHSAIARRHYG